MSTILVGIADMKIAKGPHTLTTLGLGSCVGAAIFDPRIQLGGLVHILLPSCNGDSGGNNAKYADSGIKELVDKLIALGASRFWLVAKIAGGANMFTAKRRSDIFMIGQRNVEMCKEALKIQRINLVSCDTGGSYGRTVEFDTSNGQMLIKTIGHGAKYI